MLLERAYHQYTQSQHHDTLWCNCDSSQLWWQKRSVAKTRTTTPTYRMFINIQENNISFMSWVRPARGPPHLTYKNNFIIYAWNTRICSEAEKEYRRIYVNLILTLNKSSYTIRAISAFCVTMNGNICVGLDGLLWDFNANVYNRCSYSCNTYR